MGVLTEKDFNEAMENLKKKSGMTNEELDQMYIKQRLAKNTKEDDDLKKFGEWLKR